MVALSVSTSANESSALTLSPTCLFQTTIFPSVIVSLNKGIRMTVSSLGISMAAVAGAVDTAWASAAVDDAAGAGLL